MDAGKQRNQPYNKTMYEFTGVKNNDTPKVLFAAWSAFEKSAWFKRLTQADFKNQTKTEEPTFYVLWTDRSCKEHQPYASVNFFSDEVMLLVRNLPM